MDYRRRYLRKLANQSQDNKNEEKINVNKIEEKNNQEKNEEKQNIQNIYLQKLLVKNSNSPNSSSSKIPTVNTMLSPFSNHLKDIISTEENKQKSVKYLIQKREEKYGNRSPMSKQSYQEETTSLYKNSKRNSINKFDNQDDNDNNEQENKDNKYTYPFYVKKNKNFTNFQEDINNFQDNKNDNNNTKENNYSSNTYFKKRFQVSASATNIASNNDDKDNNNGSLYFRKSRQNNLKNNENSENDGKAISKDKINKTQTRYRYFRGGNDKKEENEGDEKEENKQKDRVNNTIPINLKIGHNYQIKNEEENNYNIKVNRKRSKEFLDKTKYNEITPPPLNKKYTYVRQKYKKGNSSEKNREKKERNSENKKENVIDFNILSDNETITNTRFKRKYGRFSHNNESDNLSFKNEDEIISYVKKKYNEEKIIELFNIKNNENKKKEEELNNMRDKLNEEIKKIKKKIKN